MRGVHSPSAHIQQGSARGGSRPVTAGAWSLSGDRYSPNLARWTAKHCRHWQPEVFRDGESKLWIGFIDDGMWFIGHQLWQVLGRGARLEPGCWTFPVSDLTPVPGFWDEYARVGRCAIDTDHSRFFIGDVTRWAENGDARSCKWCGNHRQVRRRWTETVKRECWEARTENSVGTPEGVNPND